MWLNEAGHRFDQKYEVGGHTVSTVIVTSNHTIKEIFNTVVKYYSEMVVQAMERRFLQCKIENLLVQLGMKMVSTYDMNLLKKAGNVDVSKLFIDWDYLRNEATGRPIKTPEQCYEVIRQFYYGCDV